MSALTLVACSAQTLGKLLRYGIKVQGRTRTQRRGNAQENAEKIGNILEALTTRLLVPKGDHWIDMRSASRRKITRECSDSDQQHRRGGYRERVRFADAE